MSETIIDRLYQENLTLLEYLRTQGEISFHASVNDYFRKTLLLSIASYFEDTLKQSIISFVEERVGRGNLLLHFLKNKAIERQYHTYCILPGIVVMLINFLDCLVANSRNLWIKRQRIILN